MTPPRPVPDQRWRIKLVVLFDLVVLAELFFAMYVAHGRADQFTPVFLAVFFGLLLPTLALARRLLNKPTPGQVQRG